MQALEKRIKLPATFNRTYRDVVAHCKQYTMEELANLVFLGCLFAKHAPPGFQGLWKMLQPVVYHYLFARDATAEDRQAAARNAHAYASAVEQHVAAGNVRRDFELLSLVVRARGALLLVCS